MYHVNPTTGNPNKCSQASCELAHFPTKAEALEPSAVQTTLKQDSRLQEVLLDVAPVETTEDSAPVEAPAAPLKEKLESELTADPTPPRAGLTDTPLVKKAAKAGKNARKKARAGGKKAHDVASEQLDAALNELRTSVKRLKKTAPKHPLVKKGRKLFKKYL